MGDRTAIRAMVAAERRELVAFLRTLSPEDWEGPSLCAGWRVRDVVAHVSYDAVSLPAYTWAAVRARLDGDRLNAQYVEASRALSVDALVDRLEATVDGGALARLVPRICLADVLVHHQDIRRPMGRPRTIPEERLLSALAHPDPLARPGRFTRGLKFLATDVPWTQGDGPEVRGTGEALALAVVGRPVVLDELTGDGVPLLRDRVASQ